MMKAVVKNPPQATVPSLFPRAIPLVQIKNFVGKSATSHNALQIIVKPRNGHIITSPDLRPMDVMNDRIHITRHHESFRRVTLLADVSIGPGMWACTPLPLGSIPHRNSSRKAKCSMPGKDTINVGTTLWDVDMLRILEFHLKAGEVVEELLKHRGAYLIQSLSRFERKARLAHFQDCSLLSSDVLSRDGAPHGLSPAPVTSRVMTE